MVETHDASEVHQQRRDSFIEAIQKGRPILPLIILNSGQGKHYLVDGYARYRALKKLGIHKAEVLMQRL